MCAYWLSSAARRLLLLSGSLCSTASGARHLLYCFSTVVLCVVGPHINVLDFFFSSRLQPRFPVQHTVNNAPLPLLLFLFVAVLCYHRVRAFHRFDNLPHVPRGTASDANTLRVYRLHRSSGTLTLLAVDCTLENPGM